MEAAKTRAEAVAEVEVGLVAARAEVARNPSKKNGKKNKISQEKKKKLEPGYISH